MCVWGFDSDDKKHVREGYMPSTRLNNFENICPSTTKSKSILSWPPSIMDSKRDDRSHILVLFSVPRKPKVECQNHKL
jgi:hypothetical protein